MRLSKLDLQFLNTKYVHNSTIILSIYIFSEIVSHYCTNYCTFFYRTNLSHLTFLRTTFSFYLFLSFIRIRNSLLSQESRYHTSNYLITYIFERMIKLTEGNHTMDDKRIFGCLHLDNRCTCQGCPGQTEPTPERVSTHSTLSMKSSACMCISYTVVYRIGPWRLRQPQTVS